MGVMQGGGVDGDKNAAAAATAADDGLHGGWLCVSGDGDTPSGKRMDTAGGKRDAARRKRVDAVKRERRGRLVDRNAHEGRWRQVSAGNCQRKN